MTNEEWLRSIGINPYEVTIEKDGMLSSIITLHKGRMNGEQWNAFLRTNDWLTKEHTEKDVPKWMKDNLNYVKN